MVSTEITTAQFIELGGGAGAIFFNGDVNEGNMFANAGPVFGGFLRYNIKPNISVALSYWQGTLEAKDRASNDLTIKERNLSFKSSLSEIALMPEFNLLPFKPRANKQAFTAYAGVGVALILFNPTAKYQGQWVDLQPLGTEGQGLEGNPARYSLIQLAIPLSLGFKYAVGGRINVALEISYRFTFTDYLDDVSGLYLSPSKLAENGDLAIALSNRTEEYTGIAPSNYIGQRRGNANNNDGYLSIAVRLSFSLYGKYSYKKNATNPKWNKWF